MSKIIHVAFCGSGQIVRNNHLPALEARPDHYQVVGFYDVIAEKAAELAGHHYDAYSSYEALLEDKRVQLVVVATKPLDTHFPAAKQALEAGKHVLLEKPMAQTSREGDELIACAKRNNRLLTVHHNRRLDLDFLALINVLKNKKIGMPRLIINQVPNSGYNGGDFTDWGVHLIDQALLLNASPLAEVSAVFCNPAGGCENGGFGEVTLRFEQNPLVRAAMLPYPKGFLTNGTPAHARFYAAGTKGAFVQRTIEDPRDLMNATQNYDNLRPDYAIPDYLQIQRKEYYDYLYETLAEGVPLLVSAESARNAIRVLELMTESAQKDVTIAASDMLAVPLLHPDMVLPNRAEE